MKLPTLVSLVGFETKNGVLTFQFKSADGRSHYVPMKAGVLNAIGPAFVNVSKSTDESGTTIDVQPATLTSARSAYFYDGTPMLEIGLDGVMLRVSLEHPGAIPKLLELLRGFQERSGESHARH